MAKPLTDRIAELEKQQAQIAALLAQKRARLRAEERKRDTRRKIVAGALALEHAEHNPAFGQALYDILRRYVTRPDERALFGFDPLPEEPASSTPAAPQQEVA